MSFEEHCRILDEIAEAGCLWLLYTGGEIFVRKDFLKIYTYAKEKGFLITLFTNATLLTPEIADHLAEWPPFSIETTLYGRSPKVHDSITRVPGSHERCLRGIRLLKERGLPIKLKTMALTLNRHEISDTKHFVEEDLGLEFRFDAMIQPRIDASRSPLSFRLPLEEIVELDRQDPKRVAAWKQLAERFGEPARSPGHEDDLYDCGAGVHSFSIDPEGRLSLCAFSMEDTFDLRKGSFRDGWESFLRHQREKKALRPSKCLGCGLKGMCGMCPAMGNLENGDAEEPVDFLCRAAHRRAEVIGHPVKPHGPCEHCRMS